MYILSKYNLIFEYDERIIVYNTYYKTCGIFPKESKQEIYEIITSKSIENIKLKKELLDFLTDRKFIVLKENNNVDLSEQCKKLVNSNILQLTIMPSYTCNFNCTYCFQKHISKAIMTSETAHNILLFVEKNIHKFDGIYVEWFGGEPLVAKSIVLKMHIELRKLAIKNKKPYVARITTNGYELDLDTFRTLYRNNCFVYYISLDGAQQIHDKQRPHKNGQGSYKHIWNNLRSIRENVRGKNFRIEIRVNSTKETIGSMEEFFQDYQKNVGDDSRFVLVLETVQEWGEKARSIEESLISQKQLEYLAELANEYNIRLANTNSNNINTTICQAAKKNAFSIQYDGTIHKCQMAMEDPIYCVEDEIGKITEDGMQIDIKKAEKWVNDSFGSECRECIALPLCLGKKCVFQLNIKNEKCTHVEEKLIDFIKTLEICNNKENIYGGCND